MLVCVCVRGYACGCECASVGVCGRLGACVGGKLRVREYVCECARMCVCERLGACVGGWVSVRRCACVGG